MKIAFVSTAHIHTKSFLNRLKERLGDDFECSIWDESQERGRSYAEAFGATYCAALDDLTEDTSIDGFAICSENTRHLPLLEKVIPCGKPVFCEKPILCSAEELRRLRELLATKTAPALCGYFWPFGGDLQKAAAMLEENAFGSVTRVRFRNAHHAAYGRWFDKPALEWFTQSDLSGGGAFMDMGTHAIHCLRSFFGPVSEVFAEIGNHSGEYPAVDDYGMALLRFENGVLGTVEAGWTQTGGIGGLEIVGSEASLWNTDQGYVWGKPDEAPQQVEPLKSAPTCMDRLLAAIRGELDTAHLDADLDYCLDAVSIMDAAYKSSAERSWISL